MTYRNEGGDLPGRVVVGIDTTLCGLQALRLAVAEARRRGAALHAVRTWGPGPAEPAGQPPAAGLAGPLGLGTTAQSAEEAPGRGALTVEATTMIATAFTETMGGEPADLWVQAVVLPDPPGPVLAEYACREDDLLVVGSGGRGRLRRLRGSPVVRYCLRHASCPVLVVPPPPLTRAGSPRSLLRQLRREIDQLAEGGTDR